MSIAKLSAEIISILNKAGETAVQRIRNNMASTGTNATGKSSQSLNFEVIQQGESVILRVLGREYFAVVETGRRPTPQYTKPSKTFVDSIREWLVAKGKSESSAYAIAKSIHQKGTKLFRQGGRSDIFTSEEKPLIEQVSTELLDKYANLYLTEYTRILNGNNSN